MKNKDDKLSALLKQWRDIEPSANFDASVQRQLRLAATAPVETANLITLWQRWLMQPAFCVAAALVVGIAIGSTVGVLATRQSVRVSDNELQFLSAGTLAGGYVKLASEAPR